jgi:transposase InsO family protein
VSLLDEATAAGAREERACEVIGIEPRTVQRWRKEGGGEDKRQGPKTKPRNALSAEERAGIVATANSLEYRDMSPKQIVPRLADKGVYIASEASFYRVLHEADQMVHRGRAKAPEKREVPLHVANGPNQVWVWDITYVSTVVRGVFYYLYLMLDLYSRKVVGWEVYEVESMQLSSELLDASALSANITETPAPSEFTEQGDRDMIHDDDRHPAPRGPAHRGPPQIDAARVHRGV